MTDSSSSTETHAALMQRGSELHQQGLLPQALMAFEDALQATPGNLDAASAVATMLSLLGRPAAAYRILLAVETGLMQTADGATNLAIAAESCGDLARAHKAYEHALQLDPHNLRALTNVGLIASGLAQWEMAVTCARRCAKLQPGELTHFLTLADVLTSARRYTEALEVLDEAGKNFPGYLDLTVRRVTVLAFSGDFEGSMALEACLDANGKNHLRHFLSHSLQRSDAAIFEDPNASPPFSARHLFSIQAFAAMAVCDWRDNNRLSTLMREAGTPEQSEGFATWGKDSELHSLTLDLDESELMRVQAASMIAIQQGIDRLVPPFSPKARIAGASGDRRVQVGFAIQQIHQIPSLRQQLLACDHDRFSFHVYSFASPVHPHVPNALQPLAIPLIEMAHMTDAEAIARIRLDGLDIYIDTAPDARWYRPQIALARVARVQMRQRSWLANVAADPWDYVVSDTFIHPQDDAAACPGTALRLPLTCWVETHLEKAGDHRHSRESASLPADALVLCSAALPESVDAMTFSQWMKILRSVPEAIVWLPACNTSAAAQLVREASAQGVPTQRLLFSTPMSAPDMLASLAHADLVLDTLRVNQAQGMVDAIRLGVPAITCAGQSMASRLGGSILRAACLDDLITYAPQDYVAKAVRLGRNPAELAALRQRVKASRTSAPLFDTASRIREWESAWTLMAERSRAGLPPQAFDVPAFHEAADTAQ